jgi:tetratricopeptide (TPR) repeat protein
MALRTICIAFALVLLVAPVSVTAQEQSQPPSKGGDQSDARHAEMSSSKDTRIDLNPPANDAKNHPDSGTAIYDAEQPDDVQEFHPWDPHKAAKDVEVGDYYFKRKNYRAAMSRYQEALVYKPNDATANFRLAQCEEKIGEPSDAITHYEAYLKILPHGPESTEAQKSLERLKAGATKETSTK